MARVFDEKSLITLSAPGKSFLCGEYLALVGGPSLILATGPRFQLKVRKASGEGGATSPFHPEGPAGMFIQKHPDFFRKYQLEFNNPYSVGGFGASTAEYLMVRALCQFGEGLTTEHQLDLDVRQALVDYRDLHLGRELPPSGADMVGQACGWVTAFERRSGRIQVFPWSFHNLGFALFSTGTKLPTHEYLASVRPTQDAAFLQSLERLDEPCQKIWDSFYRGAEGQFLIGLNEVSRRLEDLGLQTERTRAACAGLREMPGLRAAKGCGAMGADVILVVYDKREARPREVIDFAHSLGLEFRASQEDLQPGLESDVSGGNFIEHEVSS